MSQIIMCRQQQHFPANSITPSNNGDKSVLKSTGWGWRGKLSPPRQKRGHRLLFRGNLSPAELSSFHVIFFFLCLLCLISFSAKPCSCKIQNLSGAGNFHSIHLRWERQRSSAELKFLEEEGGRGKEESRDKELEAIRKGGKEEEKKEEGGVEVLT